MGFMQSDIIRRAIRVSNIIMNFFFVFFVQPSFLNGMPRFLSSLRHNVKAEVSFDA